MEQTPDFISLLNRYLPGLTKQQTARLDLYARRLTETNKLFNLTALTDPEEIVLLHLYDSLTLLQAGYFLPGKKVLDVGTGGGVPAFPLAVCTECAVTANDATKKKLDFVEAAAKEAGLDNLSVLCGRAEELGKDPAYRESFDVVVSRGVARMNVLAEWCIPFVKVGGVFIAMKGSSGEEELQEAENAVRTLGGEALPILSCPIPAVSHSHTLLIIQKKRPTGAQYPRPNGRIKKNPL